MKQEVVYKDVLQILNEFMDGSGLRKFCQEVCKGCCCNPARVDGYACCQTVSCRDKITCVHYMCGRLNTLIGHSFVYAERYVFLRKWLDSIERAVNEFWYELNVRSQGGIPGPFFQDWLISLDELINMRVSVDAPRRIRKIPVTITRMIRRHIDENWEALVNHTYS